MRKGSAPPDPIVHTTGAMDSRALRDALRAEPSDRWTTSSSQIGRGVLMYQQQRKYEEAAKVARGDAALAQQLAMQEQQGSSSGGRTRAAVVLPVEPGTLTARPPTTAPEAAITERDLRRLEQRIADFGLRVEPVAGDGHCQYRSLAFFLDGSDARHADVRRRVCAFLEQHAKHYAPFVHDEPWGAYLSRMKTCAWGDHLTLQAFCDCYGRSVQLVTSYEDRGFIKVSPSTHSVAKPVGSGEGSRQPFVLGFWAEVHYTPLVPGL